jgi:Zn-dependent protease with chaperone function
VILSVGVSETKKRKLRAFPGLKASDFQHPSDVQASDALRSVPGLDIVMSKVMEYGFERLYYLDNIAGNVRVTPRMFGRLYKSLQWGCKILDLPDEPELYIHVDPAPNAFTYGHTKPFIVLTSGLVDMLDDEERFFVLAHELGHIKANHVLYTVLAKNIAAIMTMIGQATLGIGSLLGQGLVMALYEWFRKAELTADRAGLLCVQDLDPCIRTFMKLAGGASRLYQEMDQQEFMRQIRDYEETDRSNLNKAYKVLLTLFRTHPFPILRAKELDAWHSTGYREIAGPRGLLGPATTR